MRRKGWLAEDGKPAFAMDARWVATRDERGLICQWVSDLKPFGVAYRYLQPDDELWAKSGVLVCPLIETDEVLPGVTRPGDIDLLLIPYENGDLILSRVVAIEAKAVRATYLRQGKSPNDFGFSQASALLDTGFPYVGVVHLVTSDISPKEAWKSVGRARVLKDDKVELLPDVDADWLPVDLVRRSFGRLAANCTRPEIGLVAAYVNDRLSKRDRNLFWLPLCRRVLPNPKFDPSVARLVGQFYEQHSHRFLQVRNLVDH
jgi:hypothetical protein